MTTVIDELKNACLKHDARRIEELLLSGAPVHGRNKKGITPLMYACKATTFNQASVPAVETLLKMGADVNAMAYCFRYTPLMYVAKSLEFNIHRVNVIEKLIDAGAEVNAVDCYGYSILQRIARDYVRDPLYNDMARLLIGAGARLNAQDRNGWTPLMLACGRSSAGAMFFLNEGADPSLEDRKGRTVLSIAKTRGYRDVIETIQGKTLGLQNKERRTTIVDCADHSMSQSIASVPERAVANLDREAIVANSYLSTQLISYLGNKRYLLPFINEALKDVKKSLGKDSVVMSDMFFGSGCVARLMKYYASKLYVNDLEGYSKTLNQCHLANPSKVDAPLIQKWIVLLNDLEYDTRRGPGFIHRHYAPNDDAHIQPGERAFYTGSNARAIDNIGTRIEESPSSIRTHLLASLLVEASIHTNTSGVFRGFHKRQGVGHFGGSRGEDLVRIAADIHLEMPIFCERECDVEILQMDAAAAARAIGPVDIAYLDPPYNEHPYGSNYFMLNVINDYNDPVIQDGVVGITRDWNRSDYNSRRNAPGALRELLTVLKENGTRVAIISYSDRGMILTDDFRAILDEFGKVKLKTKEYHGYPGGRNACRERFVIDEHLWVLNLNTT